MIRRVIFASLVFCLLFFMPTSAYAQKEEGRGLYVSPVRSQLTVKHNEPKTGSMRIANYTDRSLTVNLFVQRFSAIDYSYDFAFHKLEGKDRWIFFENSTVQLKPQENREVRYTIDVPETTQPGGHYFALTASTDMSDKGLGQVAQVVSQLYVTVEGAYKKAGSIGNETVPFVVFDTKIPFTYDAANTGNIHYTAFFYGYLKGLFYEQPETGVSHILMPGSKRKVGGSVPVPFWPGIYTLTYGYRADIDDTIAVKTATVLYIPPWSIVALVLLALTVKWIWQQCYGNHKKTH